VSACLAGLLLAAGCTGDDGDDGVAARSTAYTTTVAQWRTSALKPAVDAVATTRFSDLVTAADVRPTAAQAARCATVTATHERVEALQAPVLEGKGTVEAERLSTDVVATTATWRAAVAAPLKELAGFCAAYRAGLDVSAKRAAAEKALQATKSAFGFVSRSTKQVGDTLTTTTVTCEDRTGCLPSAPAARARWLAAYRLARITLVAAEYRALGGITAPCRLSALEPVCAVYRLRLAPTVRANTGFWNAVRTTPAFTDEAKVDRAAAAAEAEAARFVSQLDAAYARAFPTLDRTAAGAETRNQVRVLRGLEATLAAAPAPAVA
jgi:hypothetical protein